MSLPSDEPRRSHWTEHAATWDHFGPPLRPHPLEMARVQALRDEHCGDAQRALLLGVTPEYAQLPWPRGTLFTAVDKCADMIAKVWPARHLPPSFRAVEGQWTALPLADQSIDLAMGDGISTVLPDWLAMDAILGELHRVCAPGGTVILRLFVKPDAPDSLARLMEDLETGRIQGFHAFKLRLLMLLQPDLATGVQPRKAWETWHALRRQHAACIEARRWPREVVNTIEAYAGSTATYWFPTLGEAMQAFERHFRLREIHYANIELGERCPMFVLERST